MDDSISRQAAKLKGLYGKKEILRKILTTNALTALMMCSPKKLSRSHGSKRKSKDSRRKIMHSAD